MQLEKHPRFLKTPSKSLY